MSHRLHYFCVPSGSACLVLNGEIIGAVDADDVEYLKLEESMHSMYQRLCVVLQDNSKQTGYINLVEPKGEWSWAEAIKPYLDWELVCDYLLVTGKCYYDISSKERYDVYCLADGFGKMSRSELLQVNGGWDWSHVRDSSPESVGTMADKIRELRARKMSPIVNALRGSLD